MKDENNQQPRQFNWLLAGLLSAFAWIVGGALGVLTVWSWKYAIHVIFRVNASPSLSYTVSLILIFLFAAILGASLGDEAAKRFIEKYEKQPLQPKFRDHQEGGAITSIVKAIAWTIFLLLICALMSAAH